MDCGVLIHEGRFTYEGKGLVRLADLGEVWEERMRLPAAARRDGDPARAGRRGRAADRRGDPRQPPRAWAHPEECADFVRRHAQEMSPDVVRRHIDLYVNDYTLDLDEAAVERLVALGAQHGLHPPAAAPLFAYR